MTELESEHAIGELIFAELVVMAAAGLVDLYRDEAGVLRAALTMIGQAHVGIEPSANQDGTG